MPVSKEQITWIAARLARAERFGLLKTHSQRVAYAWLYCCARSGDRYITLDQAEAILKYINR